MSGPHRPAGDGRTASHTLIFVSFDVRINSQTQANTTSAAMVDETKVLNTSRKT
ncbi:MAG: hypothetical protein KDB01_11410 [Planctomycetaceae bacterium]|nr:hypothetical protein [Planctomycetaceae bacterium]